MSEKYDVFDDFGNKHRISQREMVKRLVSDLREEMTEEEWRDFTAKVEQKMVIQAASQLNNNLLVADEWNEMDVAELLTADTFSQAVQVELEHLLRENMTVAGELSGFIMAKAQEHGVVQVENE